MSTIYFDCGGTSSKIALVDKNKSVKFIAPGFNPLSHNWDEFISNANLWEKNIDVKSIEHVYFFASGLKDKSDVIEIQNQLSNRYNCLKSNTNIGSDLEACGHFTQLANNNSAGHIIGILGTGSNIGFYKKNKLSQQTISAGYIFGDEGGGVDIGKRLAKLYCNGQLPEQINQSILHLTEYDVQAFISKLYSSHQEARRLLSSLSIVAKKFENNPIIQNIITASFSAFINNRLIPECTAHKDCTNIYLFGSIAYNFQDVLIPLWKLESKKPLKINSAAFDLL